MIRAFSIISARAFCCSNRLQTYPVTAKLIANTMHNTRLNFTRSFIVTPSDAKIRNQQQQAANQQALASQYAANQDSSSPDARPAPTPDIQTRELPTASGIRDPSVAAQIAPPGPVAKPAASQAKPESQRTSPGAALSVPQAFPKSEPAAKAAYP